MCVLLTQGLRFALPEQVLMDYLRTDSSAARAFLVVAVLSRICARLESSRAKARLEAEQARHHALSIAARAELAACRAGMQARALA